jgi:hypothetical protein
MPIMLNGIARAAFMFCAAAFCANTCNAQTRVARPPAVGSPITLSKALSWLPADTETLIVANGPFLIPPPETEIDEDRTRLLSKEEINEKFEALPTALVGLPEGLLKKLDSRKAAFAMEGSRHFRSPSELGEMSYEGCDIVVFVSDVASLSDAFMKDSKNVATKFEEVEGQRVAVFQEKLEEDVWTALVVFPKPNVLVVATSRDYLRDVLARIGGATAPRALPNELPEWKYINIHDHCWGLRHYDKSQANLDPSSPIGGEKSANFPDDNAIGLVFNFDAAPGREATITYLSGAKDVLEIVQDGLFPAQSDPDSIKDLRIHYREIAPGVIQGSFDLVHSEPVWYFTFVLMAVLGHGVYL